MKFQTRNQKVLDSIYLTNQIIRSLIINNHVRCKSNYIYIKQFLLFQSYISINFDFIESYSSENSKIV